MKLKLTNFLMHQLLTLLTTTNMLSEQEKQILEFGAKSGKSSTEIKAAIAKYRSSATTTPAIEATSKPTVLQRVSDVVQNSGGEVERAISGTDKFAGRSAIRRGTEATAAAFGAVPQVVLAAAPESVRSIIGKATETIGKGFNSIVDWLSERKIVKDAAGYQITNPDGSVSYVKNDTQLLEEALGTASAAGEIAGVIAGAEGTAKTLQKAADVTSTVATRGGQIADNAYKSGIDLAQRTRNIVANKVSGKNIDPQLQASAERLVIQSEPRFLEGVAERVDDPLNLYDEYLNSSRAALTDTKLDPAISKVGSDIGDAFKEVVKQRKDVGKVLASELEKVKTVKTDVLPVIDTFVHDLKENGLVYDRVTKAIRPTTAQVKIGTADQKLLQNYAQELQVLGSKPSVGEIDAFISRINDDLKLYKATNNIVGTTNAERIMLKSLADLRNQLTNTAGVPYTEARALYSDLSRFLENGESYLGKITESGDFAKDASLAKSSVQSILNNGKKDWLIELEALTGKPLLDKSVLALQAMKDAGDFRGVSLLEILNDGAIPTSKAGITQKIIDYALAKTGEALVGSPEEQTRRFLSDLMKQR